VAFVVLPLVLLEVLAVFVDCVVRQVHVKIAKIAANWRDIL